MPVTDTIGTASRDYSTWQAWEDDFDGVTYPTTLDDTYTAEGYNDSEFTNGGSGDLLTISGITTSASNYLTLKCASGQSFKDDADAATNALRYNQTNGVGLRVTGGNFTDVIFISTGTNDVKIDGLQIANQGSGNTRTVLACQGTAVVMTDCIMFLDGGTKAIIGPIADNLTISNTVAYMDSSSSSTYVTDTTAAFTDNMVFVHCTFARTSDNSATGTAFAAASNNSGHTLKDCAVFGFTTIFGDTADWTASYCGTDASTLSGTGNHTSLTYANQFENTTAASGDFRIKSGSDLETEGIYDASYANDIIGTARATGTDAPNGPDIGVWEYVAPVAGGPAPGMLLLGVGT